MMQEYPPIPTVYKRDPDTHFRTLIEGHFATDELAMLADLPWIWTEKVDGTNVRVDWDGEAVTFQGRTDRCTGLPPHLQKCLCRKLPAARFRSAGLPPMTLYGEGYGLGIQKAGKLYKSDGPSFVLFDVLGGDGWLPRNEVLDIAIAIGIEAVPRRGHGTLAEMVKRVQQPLQSSWGDFQAEGLVAKPLLELQDRYGRRIITKVKCRDFKGGA